MLFIIYYQINIYMNILPSDNLLKMSKSSWYYAYVPLDIIHFEKRDENRYINNKTSIIQEKNVTPIILGEFNTELNKYTIIDGNHRCFCAKELGYKYIPGFVQKGINDINFIKIK